MIDAQICPKCGSGTTDEVLCSSGPHHAKLVCAQCKRFLRFLPKPETSGGPPPPEVVAVCCDRIEPAQLRGTPPQVEWAQKIRAAMLARARREGDVARVLILKSVCEAGWFLANRDAGPDRIRWPELRQLAPVPSAAIR